MACFPFWDVGRDFFQYSNAAQTLRYDVGLELTLPAFQLLMKCY